MQLWDIEYKNLDMYILWWKWSIIELIKVSRYYLVIIVVMAARTFKSFLELKIPKQLGYFCLFGIDYFAQFRLGNMGFFIFTLRFYECDVYTVQFLIHDAILWGRNEAIQRFQRAIRIRASWCKGVFLCNFLWSTFLWIRSLILMHLY